MKNIQYFTLKDIKRYAGFRTVSMVRYLYKAGLLKTHDKFNPRKGRRLLFSLEAVVMGRVFRQLLDQGVSVSNLKNAIKYAYNLNNASFEDDGIKVGDNIIQYLKTDGKEIFLIEQGKAVSLTNQGQLTFSFVVDIHELHCEVVDDIQQNPPQLYSKGM